MTWVNEATEIVQKTIAETLKVHPAVRIAVCGGRSPQPLYEALNSLDLPWSKILWIQTDERYVPADHPESNAKMIREKLLAGHPETHFLPFDTTLEWEASAEAMNGELEQLKAEREPLLDLAILGVGDDGHVASLFEVNHSEDYACASIANEYPTPKRLTLSEKTLLRSSKVLVFVLDKVKKDALQKVDSPIHHLVSNLTKNQLSIFFS